jgi:micrococcal nuclease
MDEKAGKSPEEKGLTSRFSPPARFLTFLLVLTGWLAGTWIGQASGILGLELPLQAETASEARVGRVIDGDTVELTTGTRIRYIGIDTPEVRKRVGHRWVIVNEPYAAEAYRFNRKLVEGKIVRLEFDHERRDRYGRLLAYVYTVAEKGGTGLFANEALIRAGLARVVIHPPNDRYAELFYEREREARTEGVGLWKTEVHTK